MTIQIPQSQQQFFQYFHNEVDPLSGVRTQTGNLLHSRIRLFHIKARLIAAFVRIYWPFFANYKLQMCPKKLWCKKGARCSDVHNRVVFYGIALGRLQAHRQFLGCPPVLSAPRPRHIWDQKSDYPEMLGYLNREVKEATVLVFPSFSRLLERDLSDS